MGAKKISLNQIINIVILCVAGLIAINMFKGQNKKITELRQVEQGQKQKNEILHRIGGLKNRIELYKGKFKQRDRREIINTITSLATATGARIISLTPLEQVSGDMKVKSEIYDKAFFKVIVQVDSYHHLGRFVSSLENAPVMLTVNSLGLSVSSGRGLRLSPELEKMPVELIISVVYFK
ncbi:MAG: hypothetical protein ABIH40_05490 [Candidatus Omnitrophota bacterium]